MTSPLAQDLGGVVRLLEKATPGKWNHYESKYDGDVYMVQAAPPKMHVLCRYNGDGDGYTQQDVDNAAAIAAAVNFLRAHSAEIAGALRDAERWQPIESAPSEVPADDAVLVCVTYDEPRFASQRIVGEAYKIDGIWWWAGTHPDQYVTDPIEDSYGIDCVTHWRPLPAPPAQDSAMQQGGGGGEAAA